MRQAVLTWPSNSLLLSGRHIALRMSEHSGCEQGPNEPTSDVFGISLGGEIGFVHPRCLSENEPIQRVRWPHHPSLFGLRLFRRRGSFQV